MRRHDKQRAIRRHDGGAVRRRGAVVVAGLLGLSLWYGFLSAVAAEPRLVRVGFAKSSISVETRFSQKDVDAATKILISEIFRQREDLSSEFYNFDSTMETVAAIISGEIDYLGLDPVSYVRLNDTTKASLLPTTLVQYSDSRLEQLVLVGRPGANLRSLAGARLRIYDGRDVGLGALWLKSALIEAGLPSAKRHFGSVETFAKAEQALLPTFFGKADICLVRQHDYKVAVELNPQIGRKLVPLMTSPKVPFMITAMSTSIGGELGEYLSGGFVEAFRVDPDGRQALSLLGIKTLVKFSPSDLDGVRHIVSVVDGAAVDSTSATVKVKGEEP